MEADSNDVPAAYAGFLAASLRIGLVAWGCD